MDSSIRQLPQKVNLIHFNSPIKDQHRCAACYAFSALAGLEFSYNYRNGEVIQLSEQEIIDCSAQNKGCVGGNPSLVYNYIQKNGINFSNQYNYENGKKTCNRKLNVQRFRERIDAYSVTNPVELIHSVARGYPVVIVLYVNKKFKQYDSGVFNDKNCIGKLNHSTLVVGYDLTAPVPYLLVKNSWGATWGQNGYFKIATGDITYSGKGYCQMFSHEANIVPIIY